MGSVADTRIGKVTHSDEYNVKAWQPFGIHLHPLEEPRTVMLFLACFASPVFGKPFIRTGGASHHAAMYINAAGVLLELFHWKACAK